MIFKKFLDKVKNYRYKQKFIQAWIVKNKDNFTYPGIIECPDLFESLNRLSIGKKSYGSINFLDWHPSDNMLIIGSYCSISSDVKFLLGGEHKITGISTYPFKVKCFGEKKEALCKGDIVVGDDVWIGMNAIICSGITIGQGAVVAAGSVVTKNVEPYSVVGGNPAKHIKYRFSENLREKLLKIDIVKLFDSFKESDIDLIYKPLTEDSQFLK